MNTPAFFDAAPRIAVYDPLAEFLGAADGGRIEYGYGDAVKLAGHSCPTVAGAYLMTRAALARLYPDALPERGGIRVDFAASQSAGVTGVIAAVAGLVTGAAGTGGFKGLAGRYARRDLLTFDAAGADDMCVTRLDTGARATLAYHPETVPAEPALQALMAAALSGTASAQEREEFGRQWQLRVKRILIDHCDDPALIECRIDAAD
ncbi:conserved hypothetical protein [Thiobacillus denitrificans ATCC 25259]|uniref:Formylmethanofuran dehydrogenase subunit E domain-containing protein n=1 Tax=Thiobacillus denitrificans (strain ATCC 25259 / T1) TaxID=292415 RepID=Q3SGW3_THIDA|nr:hypothetical protein [Thiobacillus denitrificans]AAZ98130.1 conserved hypothetical protein [Thiobacillus denitrificans ATCC 25259]